MAKRLLRLTLVLLVCGPASALAQQQATIVGVVVDDTKAVLPGVTVTATDLATGRQLSAISDEQGNYRISNVPAGTYRLTAELQGFGSVVIPQLELLVGQNARVPLTLRVAGVEESVTVTGESPLVDTVSSQISGNVDRRQMEELPIQGRNWMELAKMVRGITTNNVGDRPGVERDEQFQLNLDGQQVTQQVASSGFGQPKFSREAIAEFQIVTNLFDITQGRSSGIQVQAITRSGTNTLRGSAYGYFRDDKFYAADPVAGVVLPFQNQQVGGTVGGPIVRDKLHYFVSYEYEREPSTIFPQPARLPNQNWTFTKTVPQNSLMARADLGGTGNDRFSFRGSYWDWEDPFFLASSNHPSASARRTRQSYNTLATWSRVISSRTIGELKVGYNSFSWQNLLAEPALADTPNLVFSGLTVGQPRNYPQEFFQHQFSSRYDLTMNRSRHDLKLGGEFIYWKDTGQWQLLSRGEFIFSGIPADIDRRIPQDAWNNPAAWDLTGLDPLVQRFDQNFGDWTIDIPRPTWAVWFGDTWRMSDRLTVNYGVRWDVDWGALNPPHVNQPATFDPINGVPYGDVVAINAGDRLYETGLRDLNNVAPRAGFNYKVNDTGDLVIRGGTGLYFGVTYSNITFSQQSFNGDRILVNSWANDLEPGFLLDPRRGVSLEDLRSGRVPLPPQAPRVIAHDFQMPYTWQSSIGFQKQLNTLTGVEVDLTHWKQYNDPRERDLNLFFDPATGYNLNPATFGRPDPKWGQISWLEASGHLDYLGLSSGLTRRLSNNFQGGITYTVMFYKHDDTTAGFQAFANNQFDFDGEWSRSTDFQRHTIRTNAMVQLPWGFSLAGTYSYGSGNYFATSIGGARPFNKPGTNRLNIGAPIVIPETVRDRFEGPDVINTGDVAPRNALRGEALHKVDLRVTKEFRLRGNLRISGIAEVFNLFNHENFGAYNGQINTTTFGQPNQDPGSAYVPRSAQFGFRVNF